MTASTYFEISALLAVSAVCGTIAIRLRQPLLVAFIVVGILVGPAALGWVRSHDEVELLAELGVTVLLFVVGLKLDPKMVRHLGPVALATGLGQLSFTIVFGLLIALALGLAFANALYVAVALTFSSTIIIVKLLSDKRELDSLHGRIAVGFLIVQDIAVVIAMTLLGSARAGAEAGWLDAGASIAARLAAALLAVWLAARYVVPAVLRLLARSQELLLLFAVAWATTLATAGEMLGFSKEVGAFLAGFSLASTPYKDAVAGRLAGLRDFLLLFFFVALGSRLEFGALGEQLLPAAVLSAFVLVGNPLIVMAIMGWMGYRKRTGFMAGLTVAQISEFSIVFVAMGIQLGHIDESALALTTLVGLATITTSTYMILYSEALYRRLEPWLGVFEREMPAREMAYEEGGDAARADAIVFGIGRYGGRLASRLRELGADVLGVDFDPEAVNAARARGLRTMFGDAEDSGLLDHLPLRQARWAISALPDVNLNLHLARSLAAHGFDGRIAMAAHSEEHGAQLRAAGVHHVLYPFDDAADFAAELAARDLALAAKEQE